MTLELAFAENERTTEEVVPYSAIVDDHTVVTDEGDYFRVWRIGGVPFDCASDEAINQWNTELHALLLNLSATRPLVFYSYINRRKVTVHPEGEYAPGFAAELGQAYEQKIARDGFYLNELYLAVAVRTNIGDLSGTFAFFARLFMKVVFGARNKERDVVASLMGRLSRDEDRLRETLETLEQISRMIEDGLAAFAPRRLGSYQIGQVHFSEVKAFLGNLINGERRPYPLFGSARLKDALATTRSLVGVRTGELRGAMPSESKLFAQIGIKEYPHPTYPGMMNLLLSAPWEGVLAQSFLVFSQETAKDRVRRQERLLIQAEHEARGQIGDLRKGLLEKLASGEIVLGQYHFALRVEAQSNKELEEGVTRVTTELGKAGVVVVRESKGTEPAHWSLLPGNYWMRPRVADITSENYVDLTSFHAFPLGKRSGNHWGGHALTLMRTTSGEPYHFNIHAPHTGGNGHTLMCGETGAGKTALQNSIVAMLNGKCGATAVCYDHLRGMEIFIRAMGGTYLSFLPGVRTGLAPLMGELDPERIDFMQQFVRMLVTIGHPQLLHEQESELDLAVRSVLMQLPPEQRQLSKVGDFLTGKHGSEIMGRLEKWIGGGRLAWMFDNPVDTLSFDARIVGFNMTHLLESEELRLPIMMYLFHRHEEVIDGRPSVVVVDEFQKMLGDDYFVSQMEDRLAAYRKKNCALIATTASPEKIIGSKISAVFRSSAQTKCFLSNRGADQAVYMNGFDLSEEEFKKVKGLSISRRQFLLKQGNESVVLEFDLSGLSEYLAILSGSEPNAEILDQIRARVGNDPAVWRPVFERERRK